MDAYETKVLFTLLGGAAAIAFALGCLFISLLRQQRINTKLQLEKTQAEIATLEQERKRMASDIHDEVAPVLTVIKMKLDTLRATTSKDIQTIAVTKKLLQDAIQKLRETYDNLMPELLYRKGLLEAIRSSIEDIEDTGAIKVRLYHDKQYLPASSEDEIHLYRIFQEAIHNCLQHAEATTFTIRILQRDSKLELMMQDDGKGFNYDLIKKGSAGHGLRNISNRVDLLNGDFYVDTKPGKGVKYTIVI
jgi:two-component system, NarL family, sensor kinase